MLLTETSCFCMLFKENGLKNKAVFLTLHHTEAGYVNVTVYSSTGDVYVYTEAMLSPVFNSHTGPRCIVGVGVAERSHLPHDNSNVLSRERKNEEEKERVER